MDQHRAPWALAGIVAGAVGLGLSALVAEALSRGSWPVTAMAEAVIRLVPGRVIEPAIRLFGTADKPFLVAVVLVVLLLLAALVGVVSRRRLSVGVATVGLLAAVGLAAVLSRSGSGPLAVVATVVGAAGWVGTLVLAAASLREAADGSGDEVGGRRPFLLVLGLGALAAAASGVGARLVRSSRRHLEDTVALIKLDNVTLPEVPSGARLEGFGLGPWMTPSQDFFQVHTAIVVPTIEPDRWRLRIHGLVDHPLTLTYRELVERRLTEDWVTINCVSNPVGGDLVGNAWWSGVRLAELLDRAGVRAGADAVLQTSEDGWTCSTPLAALTDDRNAMLAVAMNGKPLPIDHGFPVRTIVPGLYGYVSACKWVVDLEVTSFDRVSAYWTERGWAEEAPVKLASRIDVPRDGDSVPAGELHVGGVAWAQHTGISDVEVSLDGGPWQPAVLGGVPNDDCWVQWVATVEVGPGDHRLRVRATDRTGLVQTGVVRDVLPDGATGWHTVEFGAE